MLTFFFLERLDIDLVITACGAHSLVFEWTVIKFNLSSAPASEVSMDILINMEKETIPRIYISGDPADISETTMGKNQPMEAIGKKYSSQLLAIFQKLLVS